MAVSERCWGKARHKRRTDTQKLRYRNKRGGKMKPTDSPETFLETLANPRSRAIIAAVAQDRCSVSEISEYCDLPLSTSYRKVDTLVENGILEDTLRINSSGRHEQEYTLSEESVSAVFRVDDAVDVRVSYDASDASEDRMLRMTAPVRLD